MVVSALFGSAMETFMPNLYDDIMRLLHEAGAFAELEEQKKLARLTRYAQQIAESEIQIGSTRNQATHQA